MVALFKPAKIRPYVCMLTKGVNQVIEGLDPHHGCTEYWASKLDSQLTSAKMDMKKSHFEVAKNHMPAFQSKTPETTFKRLFGVDIARCEKDESNSSDNTPVEDIQHVLGGLFKKASVEELKMLQTVFNSRMEGDGWMAAVRTLTKEIQNNVHR